MCEKLAVFATGHHSTPLLCTLLVMKPDIISVETGKVVNQLHSFKVLTKLSADDLKKKLLENGMKFTKIERLTKQRE